MKKYFKIKLLAVILPCLLYLPSVSIASIYTLPLKGDNVVGVPQVAFVEPGETLGSVGMRFDIGYYEMVEANPGVNVGVGLRPWTKVIVPSRFIIPDVKRSGVVINLAELRLYYFPRGKNTVVTYPVGIGREGWATPQGVTKIVAKAKNPTWYPPAGVRAEAARNGYELPLVVPPGPDNPLGGYAMLLGWDSYLMHSTNRPDGVGRRSSAGCIRMFPDDAEWFFNNVNMGTTVQVIDEPYKAGWLASKFYLEAHQPLQESDEYYETNMQTVMNVINKGMRGRKAKLNWRAVRKVAQRQAGVPEQIGNR